MALPIAVISYDLSNIGLGTYDPRRSKIWATTNIADDIVVDPAGNRVHIGASKGTIDDNGVGSVSVVAPAAGSVPATWQTYVHVEYVNGRHRDTVKFGPYTVTASANLADLQAQQGVPPVFSNQLTMDAYLTQTKQARDAALLAAEQAADDRAYVEGRVINDLGTSDGQMTAIAETEGTAFRASQLATIGRAARTVSANAYGASTVAPWETNRDAINAAIQALAASGYPGTVLLSPGTYTVKGILLDHGAHLDLTDVTLTSPDGNGNVIEAIQRDKPGSYVTADALTVPNTTGIKVGSVVAVQYAGGLLDSQTTNLTANINSAQTTGITLTSINGLSTAGVLQIGTELIQYTGRDGGTLTGVTRGAFGRTATPHLTIAPIAPARRHYAIVEAIAGNVVTLDTPVTLNVSGVEASFGVVGGGVVGRGMIDGNKILPSGSALSSFGINAPMVRAATFDVQVRNGDQGGFMLSRGAADNRVEYVGLHDCGIPAASKGSSFWLYQACKRNRIDQIVITGEAWTAIYLDDRTTLNEEGWDGPNVGNSFGHVHIDIQSAGFAPALSVVSGNENVFHGGFLSSTAVGYAVAAGSQGVGSVKPLRNKLGNFTIKATQAILMHTSAQDGGNIVHDVFVTADSLDTGLNSASTGNLIYAVSQTPGAAPSIPMRGSIGGSGSPAFAFTGDPNTGLYSDSPDVVGLSAGSVAAVRAMTTETRFYGTDSKIHSTGYWQLKATAHGSDPTAATAGTGRLFFRLNAAGKTELCARFPTGTPQVISTEP